MEIIRVRDGRFFEVIEERPGGELLACNVGGGFQVRIPLDRIEERDVELPMNDYELMTVGFDDEPFCRAWVHRTFRWNGWLQPLVTAAELPNMIAAQDRFNASAYPDDEPGDWGPDDVPEDGLRFFWDGGEAPLIVRYGANVFGDGEDRMELPAESIEVDMGGEDEVDSILVWDVSLGLTWSRVEVPADHGIVPGARVRVIEEVHRYPHFIVPEGALGTVSSVESARLFWVELDETIDGAEEWDNAVSFDATQNWVEDDSPRGGHLDGESLGDIMEQIEVLPAASCRAGHSTPEPDCPSCSDIAAREPEEPVDEDRQALMNSEVLR